MKIDNKKTEEQCVIPVVSNNEVTVCGNCGSPWVIKTYDGYWCKHCKTEL